MIKSIAWLALGSTLMAGGFAVAVFIHGMLMWLSIEWFKLVVGAVT